MPPLHSNHNLTPSHSTFGAASDSPSHNHNLSTITSNHISIRLAMPPLPSPSTDSSSNNRSGRSATAGEALKEAIDDHRDAGGTLSSNARAAPGASQHETPSFVSAELTSNGNTAQSPFSSSLAKPTSQRQEQEHAHFASVSSKGAFGGNIATLQTIDASSILATTIPTSPASDYADAQEGDDNKHEDSDSSDVEIYLNPLALHDSAARMHIHASSTSGKCHFLFI